jgi:nitroreductase
MKVIDIRRSVRKFKEKEVEQEKIEKLLRAAMQAPSAGNQQPWEFVIVYDQNKKIEIAKMSPYSGVAAKAPYIIVVAANKEKMRFPENMEQDLGACTQNILLEAVNQELGTVWMSVYPQEERKRCIKSAVHLPEHIIPYSIILVGYPEDENANHFIDRFDGTRVHYEIFGS